MVGDGESKRLECGGADALSLARCRRGRQSAALRTGRVLEPLVWWNEQWMVRG